MEKYSYKGPEDLELSWKDVAAAAAEDRQRWCQRQCVVNCKSVTQCYSTARGINLSIVQGSGIGPCLYIVMESDLNPLSRCNILIKYADDTNLLIPEHTDCSLADKFTHIYDWARDNKMCINITKTKKLFFTGHIPLSMTCRFHLIV